MSLWTRIVTVVVVLLLLGGCGSRPTPATDGPVAGWAHYGNDAGGRRYSPLTQITPDNVANLEVAWIYHTGDISRNVGVAEGRLPAFESTPLMIDDKLFLCTPHDHVVALDPRTGRKIWSYDYHPHQTGRYLITCRGVVYYRSPTLPDSAPCKSRILMGTIDARLVALDAETGRLCQNFGNAGMVDLTRGLGTIHAGDYKVTSPPVVIHGKVITGALVEDNQRVDAPPGVIRAFDVETGRLVWAWDPIPPNWVYGKLRPKGDGDWQAGTANAWSVFSVDPTLDLVYVPTGNASPDFYDGERKGLDYYSSSLVALDADTGKVAWRFQTVHHDVWDYDVASQPVLFDYPGSNGPVPAVAQATKQGFVFILDRRTGKPLFDVKEVPVPQIATRGMTLSPTQPAPVAPPSLLGDRTLTIDDMWGFTPFDRHACRKLFRKYVYDGPFTPPTEQGSITYPNNLGASNWGSVSIDPQRGLLIANSSRVATVNKLIPRAEAERRTAAGRPPVYRVAGSRYAVDQFPLLSPFGAPCNRPPWGVLTAIDLRPGARKWEVPLGTTRDLAPFPLWLKLGVPNQGGSLLTATGLVFIGATTDSYIRAFDIETGRELWRHRLPAGGQATPMTYRLSKTGRQYVVIAAGGHAYLGSKLGDAVVAFALPAASGD